jgi:hypothetical protein
MASAITGSSNSLSHPWGWMEPLGQSDLGLSLAGFLEGQTGASGGFLT